MFNAQAFAWAHVSPFDLNLIADFAGEGARATQKQKGAGWMPAPLSCLYI